MNTKGSETLKRGTNLKQALSEILLWQDQVPRRLQEWPADSGVSFWQFCKLAKGERAGQQCMYI
jgi:hypothetical protein